MLALLMRVVSSYDGGLSQCVANAASSASTSHNLAGGYANIHGKSNSDSHHAVFDPFTACGASGPVGFVSFISGLLFWFNIVLAMVLYSKREEILSGGSSSQYDEIGVNDHGFAGDFPSSSGGIRTMHV
ncbi:hypothetical protein ACHAXR_009223 [Thalassiosira sp. AJA248-18]